MTTRSIAVGSGPGVVELDVGVITDTQLVRRNGTSLEGISAASVTAGAASGLVETSGPTTLTMGAVADTEILTRSGSTIDGVLPATLAATLAPTIRGIDFTLTPVPDATYSWDSTALNLAITHAAANVDVTLPDATQVTNWVPGTPPRRAFTMNTSAFGWDLLAPADVSINGGPLGTDMQPVPDSNTAPSPTALGQWVYVYRETAAAYWVWGGA
jgi:hypothetical protein